MRAYQSVAVRVCHTNHVDAVEELVEGITFKDRWV